MDTLIRTLLSSFCPLFTRMEINQMSQIPFSRLFFPLLIIKIPYFFHHVGDISKLGEPSTISRPTGVRERAPPPPEKTVTPDQLK